MTSKGASHLVFLDVATTSVALKYSLRKIHCHGLDTHISVALTQALADAGDVETNQYLD